ncbi:DNA repair exonuclease [Alicyclobacillus sp. SO9]|uniref:metallophosphoesterase family protein n=1 Tax=Alicyclobacillus sp. SO9 TaxID=2665646 RepID=UPI0018E839F6|nr:DNA repair exonuclease [Alicyclobacillus sp. SO9]QQE77425.1 DNA repair exonuclease [Alicyclobacillus sp. SO9]
MTSVRFLHTADLHMGTPFRGLTRDLPQAWSERLQHAAETVFDRIVDEACLRKVDFVTIAGDLFDREGAAMSAHFALLKGFRQLEKAGIQVVLTHGNHDPIRGEQPIHWPGNVTVLGPCETTAETEAAPSVILETASGHRVQVSGFSYTAPEMRRPMHHAFIRQRSVDFAIGLYHGAVGSYAEHENYCATTVDNLSARQFDFWGLGHIHQPQVLRKSHPGILYPGNPQGRHARESGERGCALIELSEGGHVEFSFLPIATVEWESLSVSLDECQDLRDVLSTLSAELERFAAHHDVFRIARIQLTGITPVHKWLVQDEETVDEFRAELSSRFPKILVSRLAVATMPAADIDKLRNSQEFVGEFLRLCETYLNNPEKITEELGVVLRDVFHAGNGLAVEQLTEEELRGLLLRARGHALAFVGEEDTL